MTTDKPTVTITEAARGAVRDAAKDDEPGTDNVLRISIDPRFQNDLFFGPREAGDVVITASGITMAMDAGTARRANGLTIDYVDARTGTGFRIDNPNASPPVKGIRPADLVGMLERGEELELIDARPQQERAKAVVDASRLLDERYEIELLAMPTTRKLVFLAHHTRGGQSAAQRFFERGFTDVWYVVGGIDSWSTMDASIPRY